MTFRELEHPTLPAQLTKPETLVGGQFSMSRCFSGEISALRTQNTAHPLRQRHVISCDVRPTAGEIGIAIRRERQADDADADGRSIIGAVQVARP
jgi:hypothetical protein